MSLPDERMCSRVFQRARDIEGMARACLSIVAATVIALFSVTGVAETPATTGTSGIEGTVLVSPSRPGPIRKDDGPSVAPVGNTQFVVKAGEATVKTFTTDTKVASKSRYHLVIMSS